ncbi:MAG: hypothetical protein AAF266_14645, partial [Planctomycetota bacterium]
YNALQSMTTEQFAGMGELHFDQAALLTDSNLHNTFGFGTYGQGSFFEESYATTPASRNFGLAETPVYALGSGSEGIRQGFTYEQDAAPQTGPEAALSIAPGVDFDVFAAVHAGEWSITTAFAAQGERAHERYGTITSVSAEERYSQLMRRGWLSQEEQRELWDLEMEIPEVRSALLMGAAYDVVTSFAGVRSGGGARAAAMPRKRPVTPSAAAPTQSIAPKSSAGPYAHLDDHPSVGPGKNFTASQKQKILDANEARNGGVLRSDQSGEVLQRAKKHQKGVRPPDNEAQIDHDFPKSLDGTNRFGNARVLSRLENLKKSNKVD